MTNEFLEKYKQLEQLVIEHYPVPDGTSAIWALGDVKEFVPFRPQLTAIREIRNFLAHTPGYEAQSLIMPTESAIKIVNNMITKIDGPKNVYSICYKPHEILSAKIDDEVAPIVRLMQDRSYQVVPILNNGKVEGIFFDSATVLKEIESGQFAPSTTFFSLKDYISIEKHIGKNILFMAKATRIETAKETLSFCFKSGCRIAAILITENGKVGEGLLGLLLPLQLL